MSSEIVLVEPASQAVKIVQLYEHVELYSAGEPPQHTLFVLGRAPLAMPEAQDQLLLIDPPADASERFKLTGNVAILFTGAANEVGLPQLQTVPGGVAHIRIGDHFLDVYSQRQSNVVYLPALGILCGGSFGSDATLPELAPGSDGSEELDTLRLLARLVKQRLQLYIPRIGALASDPTQVMTRLANDVAYLHSLRRVAPAILARGDEGEAVQQVAESLLPTERRSPLCRTVHWKNVQGLLSLTGPRGVWAATVRAG